MEIKIGKDNGYIILNDNKGKNRVEGKHGFINMSYNRKIY